MPGDNTRPTPYIYGATDNTTIGNVGDRLKTDAQVVTTSKTRIDTITSSVTLTTGVFTPVYSYTGSGMLCYFNLEFNNTSIIPRLQIDGETVFSGLSLAQWGAFIATSNSTDRRGSGSGIVISGASIDFSLKYMIRFNSSVVVSADANGGVLLSRQLSQGIVYITKET